MADLHDDDHLFEDMTPESPGAIERNIVRRLRLANQVAEAIIITQMFLDKLYIMITELMITKLSNEDCTHPVHHYSNEKGGLLLKKCGLRKKERRKKEILCQPSDIYTKTSTL